MIWYFFTLTQISRIKIVEKPKQGDTEDYFTILVTNIVMPLLSATQERISFRFNLVPLKDSPPCSLSYGVFP